MTTAAPVALCSKGCAQRQEWQVVKATHTHTQSDRCRCVCTRSDTSVSKIQHHSTGDQQRGCVANVALNVVSSPLVVTMKFTPAGKSQRSSNPKSTSVTKWQSVTCLRFFPSWFFLTNLSSWLRPQEAVPLLVWRRPLFSSDQFLLIRNSCKYKWTIMFLILIYSFIHSSSKLA